MACKPAPPEKSLREWRITLVRKKGQYLGRVEAPDAGAAIKVAIETFGVTDRERQRRLSAQPIVEHPH